MRKKITSTIILFILIINIQVSILSSNKRMDVNQVTLPTLDGVISTDEYQAEKQLSSSFMFYWSFNEENSTVFFGMVGQVTGWVTIGFEPTFAMADADMVFGWVTNDEAFILDCYSTGSFGPHPPDTDLGGTNDILAYAGSETDGSTIIEFSRELTTADTDYDNELEIDTSISVIWGVHSSSDDYTSKHTSKGSDTFTITTSGSETSTEDTSDSQSSTDTESQTSPQNSPSFEGLMVIMGATLLTILGKKRSNKET